MFVAAKQFEFTLPGKLCQTVDIFPKEIILQILLLRHEIFDILTSRGKEFFLLIISLAVRLEIT